MNIGPSAFARVGLIAFGAVILQLSAFGPMLFFGGAPDLVPLAVAAVALYAGSVPGAAVGFVTGFLLDLAVGGTMGVSSLVLTAVGYGVGRYREVRDPAHGLLAIPVGAVATAGWVLAFAAVSFMLDVAAQVDLLVFRDMFVTDPAQRCARDPGVRPVPVDPASRARDRSARAPPPPARARWRRVRSVCAGSRSDVPRPGQPPPDAHPAARAEGGDHRWARAGAVRRRLLPTVVPAGALGRQVRDRGQLEPGPQDQGAGPAGGDRGPRGAGAREQPHRPGRARDPDELPDDEGARREVFKRLGTGAGDGLRANRAQRGPAAEGASVLPRDGQAGRPPEARVLPVREPGGLPGGHCRAGVPARVSPPRDRRPPVRHRGRDHQGAAGRPSLPRCGARRQGGPVRHRVPVRPLPAWTQRREGGPGRRQRQPARPAAQRAARAGAPAAPVRGPRRPARGAVRAGGRTGRLRGDERDTTGRCWLSAARPRSTPTCSPRSSASATSTGSTRRTTASRSSTARSRPAIPRARRSSSSRPPRRCREGSSRRTPCRPTAARCRSATSSSRTPAASRTALSRCGAPSPCRATSSSTAWARRPTAPATAC